MTDGELHERIRDKLMITKKMVLKFIRRFITKINIMIHSNPGSSLRKFRAAGTEDSSSKQKNGDNPATIPVCSG
jgi:nucleoid DNA-binding protein